MRKVVAISILLLFLVPPAYLAWRYILMRKTLDGEGELANLRREIVVEWAATVALLLLALYAAYAFYLRNFHLWLSARPNMIVLQMIVLMAAGMSSVALSFWRPVRSDVVKRKAIRYAGVGSILIGSASLLLLFLPHLFLHWGTALAVLGFVSLGWGQVVKIRGLRIRVRSIA